ncbi:MAG: LacI family DNA-binding transcriptional regulator [Clostridia bacterium]|nr:LacI family DNA-binding transcriptional regulator [Clostridia bacterium]
MSATISDVAKRAGVSPATVSKYLNHKAVSSKSYAHIEQAVRELNYQVNDFARGLRTNTSKMIGLLVWSIDNIFSTSLFNEIEKRLIDINYSLVLCNYNKSAAVFAEKIAFLRQRMVDGVVIQLGGRISEQVYQELCDLQAAHIPFVLVNNRVDGIEADAVLPDDAQTIYDCVTHLLEHGHRKIGMIMAPRNAYKIQERKAGFCRAYADAGLTADEELLFSFDDENRWPVVSKEKITGFLQAHPELTALVLPGYRLTIAGINALHHLGREIGKDVALIGFDCGVLNDVLKPPVTYIQLPAEKIAADAVELLIDAIRSKEDRPPRLIRISAQRIDGESVFRI